MDIPQIEAARGIVEIVSVQNMYNLPARDWDPVVEYCARERIAFIPWFPIMSGALSAAGGVLAEIAVAAGATPAQIALAWLLARADVTIPIPGISSVAHLEENAAAAQIALTAEQMETLSAAAVAWQKHA